MARLSLLLSVVANVAAIRSHPAVNVSSNAKQIKTLVHNVSSEEHKAAAHHHTISEECMRMAVDLKIHAMHDRQAAHICEQKGKFENRTISALQNEDTKNAVEVTTQLLEQCGNFSHACAKEAADGVVVQLRFSGIAVSDKCSDEMRSAQEDQERMKKTSQCDDTKQYSKQTLVALNDHNLDGAVDAAQQGLVNCMNISKKCSFQVAPVLVNEAVMEAMAEQEMAMMAMMLPRMLAGMGQALERGQIVIGGGPSEEPEQVVVMKASPVMAQKAKPQQSKKRGASFLEIVQASIPKAQTSARAGLARKDGIIAPALVQEETFHWRPAVSSLVMDLALKQQ